MSTSTPVFAVNPAALVKAEDFRDYSEKNQLLIYNAATAGLYQDSNERFDLKSSKVQSFLDKVAARGDAYNLTTLRVPATDADIASQTPTKKNFCSHHGEFTKEHLVKWVATYIGQPSRYAQDDDILKECLQKSLQDASLSIVMGDTSAFTVNGVKSGLLMLKSILSKSAVGATANAQVIRIELANTYLKFRELEYKVPELNNWVTQRLNKLAQMGATSTDIVAHLFAAYETSPNPEFVAYINAQKDTHYDEPEKEFNHRILMDRAEDKYERLEVNRAMKVLHPPPPDNELVNALQTTIQALMTQISEPKDGEASSTRGKPSNKKNKKTPHTPYGAWKGVPKEVQDKPMPPYKDLATPIKVDGSKWYYCMVHKWCPHPWSTQGDKFGCKFNPDNTNEKAEKDETKPKEVKPDMGDRQGRVVRALAAIIKDK